MSDRIEPQPKKIDKGIAFRLWIGLLLPPVSWSIALESLYLATEYGCLSSSGFTLNHIVVVIAFAASILAGIIAWREWTATGGGYEEDGGDRSSRRRFMSLLGILTSALFSVAILAQWMPTLMGVPCDK
jgi:hypothetical protein